MLPSVEWGPHPCLRDLGAPICRVGSSPPTCHSRCSGPGGLCPASPHGGLASVPKELLPRCPFRTWTQHCTTEPQTLWLALDPTQCDRKGPKLTAVPKLTAGDGGRDPENLRSSQLGFPQVILDRGFSLTDLPAQPSPAQPAQVPLPPCAPGLVLPLLQGPGQLFSHSWAWGSAGASARERFPPPPGHRVTPAPTMAFRTRTSEKTLSQQGRPSAGPRDVRGVGEVWGGRAFRGTPMSTAEGFVGSRGKGTGRGKFPHHLQHKVSQGAL